MSRIKDRLEKVEKRVAEIQKTNTRFPFAHLSDEELDKLIEETERGKLSEESLEILKSCNTDNYDLLFPDLSDDELDKLLKESDRRLQLKGRNG